MISTHRVDLLGQYEIYVSLLEITDPKRKLYLAISEKVYEEFFTLESIQVIITRLQVPLIVVNPENCEMDKLTERRNLMKRILTEYVDLSKSQFNAGVEHILIMDDDRGHYLWLKLGWENGKRVKYITVYARLHEGKFWIEEDWTEDGIATDLMREGVPKEDIVLAFHDHETRKQTDFAAA